MFDKKYFWEGESREGRKEGRKGKEFEVSSLGGGGDDRTFGENSIILIGKDDITENQYQLVY